MGKNGIGRRRRKGREADRLAARYAERAQLRHVDDVLSYEESKKKQLDYQRFFVDKEQEILSCTVFVDCARDLNNPGNLQQLQQFMASTFGPVFECKATYYPWIKRSKQRNKFPPARVRFLRKTDAEKIFGGLDLIRASANRSVKWLMCPIGYKNGTIRVRPSELFPDMMGEELKGAVISLDSLSVSMGHWCRAQDEMMVDSAVEEAYDEWLEEVKMAPPPQMMPPPQIGAFAQAIAADIWGSFDGHASAPQIRIDLNKRTIELVLHQNSGMHSHRLSFQFKHLASRMTLYRESDGFCLVFSLKHPPKLEFNILLGREEELSRYRTIRWGPFQTETIGRCLGYKLSLSKTTVEQLLYHDNWNKLREFGVFSKYMDSIHHLSSLSSLNVGDDCSRYDRALSEIQEPRVAMHLRSLLDHGKFCWFHALNDTATFDRVGAEHTIFQAVQMHRVDLTLATLNRMLDTRGQRTKYPCQVFYKLLPPSDVPLVVSTLSAYCVSIPRLVVTPLRQFFIGVETEMSNRVIRRYTARPQFSVESFLRVQVSDEDGRNLFDRDLTRDVETRIKSALVNGVSICGRAYKFLAYSSSQLKDSSLWMVHLPPGWSVQAIRNELGDFDSCKIPSKYAARIGQCFSTTVEGLPSRECAGNLLQPSVRHAIIDDIESQHAGRKMCHSDGNGLIRRDAMDQLLKRVVFAPTDTRDASIVQVRYAGAKGTLTAWTAVDDDRLSNSDVLVRNSMIKFDAPYDQLEVVKVGAHVGYHLNRNVIFLLQAHGVPEYTILDMQRSMLDDLDEMLTCRQKALQMLPSLSGPDSAQRATLLHMLHSGMSPTSEPVLLDTLTGIRSHHLYCLRKKARIFVKKGAVLMGGLDVTGLLLEGCVFVQLRRASLRGASEESGTQNAYEPIVGPVLVTKHPVMHPGDVRMMLAVDIPELRDHRNAILFSQQGSRPAADMMSGSDLDGDEFAVTFDERLFLRGWNGCRKEEDGQFVSTSGIRLSLDDPERAARILQDTNDVAMDFDVNESSSSSTVPPNLPAEDDARSEALIEHFFGHIKLASVGRICMMWLDYASVSPDGGRCAECLTLAHLHSVAVDYPKSGVPAEIPRDLFWPRSRPRAHWREMKGGSFDCESTVGKLYDEVIRRARNSLPAQSSKALAGRAINKYGQVVCFAAGDKVENHLHEVYNPRIPFLLLGTHISTGIQRFALEQRRGYESDVSQLINKYKLSSEGELLTGCIRKYHKLNKKRSHQFAEDVRRQSRELRRKYRSAFFQKVLKIVDVDWSKNRPTAESHADDALHELASDMGRTTSTAEQDDASVDLDASSSDDDLLVDQDDCEEEDEEPDEELLKWVKDLATSRDVSRNGSTREAFARGTAQQLAAAYYMATYSPALRFGGRDRRLALFSFPWVVADVIAFGMLEAESSSEPE